MIPLQPIDEPPPKGSFSTMLSSWKQRNSLLLQAWTHLLLVQTQIWTQWWRERESGLYTASPTWALAKLRWSCGVLQSHKVPYSATAEAIANDLVTISHFIGIVDITNAVVRCAEPVSILVIDRVVALGRTWPSFQWHCPVTLYVYYVHPYWLHSWDTSLSTICLWVIHSKAF
jgi:hypothetical protein